MITSLALTITQPNQRPLHVSTCSVTLGGDHFEFIAHSPSVSASSSSSKNNSNLITNDPFQKALDANQYSKAAVDPSRNFFNNQQQNSSSHHIGSYRGVFPKSSSSSNQNSFEPTPAFIVRLFFKDITKMEIVPEICQIIVSTTSPAHNAFFGPAAAESVSPEHRRAYFEDKYDEEEENEFIHHHAQNISSGKNFFDSTSATDDGSKNSQQKQQADADEYYSPTPTAARKKDNNIVGHQKSGGIKRQYILIFKEEHVTEVWYKSMTETVEEWASKFLPNSKSDFLKNQERLAASAAKNKNTKNDNSDIFGSDDVIDVEKAISNLDRKYYRSDTGWSSPKRNGLATNNGDEEKDEEGGRNRIPISPKAQKAFEKEHQNQVNQMKRRLLPKWGDITSARDEIVKGILKKGALPMVESTSSPRREQTFEYVKQAKLMELKELENESAFENHSRSSSRFVKENPPTSATGSSGKQSPIPLLSVASKPETSRPLLSTASSYNSSIHQQQPLNLQNSSSNSKNPVPLLSTDSSFSKPPLLSTTATLQQPIQPTTTFNTNNSSINNTPDVSYVPSRSGTPPPRQPINVNDGNNNIPLLSTAPPPPPISRSPIPSSSTAVLPPSSSNRIGVQGVTSPK